MKILIIDQDAVSSKILMLLLKHYGQCQRADSIAAAAKMFQTALREGKPYQAVFLEMALPDGSGCLAMQCLREVEQEFSIAPAQAAKFIVISGPRQSSVEETKNYCSIQWEGFLAKPIYPETLEREMQRLALYKPQAEVFEQRKLTMLMIDVGDKEIVKELVAKFMAELPEKLAEMQHKLQEKEYGEVQKIAHRIASLSGTYGFSRLMEILRRVEYHAAQGSSGEIITGLAAAASQVQDLQASLTCLLADCEVRND